MADLNHPSPEAMGEYIPGGLLMQWHLTERCNLRCSHCYQQSYDGEELGFSAWLEILEQYQFLLRKWRQRASDRKIWGQITITGGEPFIHNDIWNFLPRLARENESFSFAVLTNGSLLDEAMVRELACLKPRYVQVSLEGRRQTHDQIRGAGNFDRVVMAIRFLVNAGINTMISFTAHRGNYREFPEVCRLAGQLRVNRVWADRFSPTRHDNESQNVSLSPVETRELMSLMLEARTEMEQSWLGRTEVAMHRALQFLASGQQAYHCTAGDILITVLPNGDLCPCRRMPVVVGNVMKKSISDLYQQSPEFIALRDRERSVQGCERCAFASQCRGGLRCLAYAVHGNMHTADPGCWLAKWNSAN
jgi:radical SAM protein with 4Fe4S-binding SPASM domain